MDEEKIIIQSEENETTIDVENIELNAGRQETVEYIEVTEPEAITIEFEESFGTTGNSDGVTHSSLPDRNDPNQHVISAIEGLQDILDKLSAIKDTVYAVRSGFAEFRPWLKQGYYETEDLYQGTGGVGYFVSLVAANNNLDGNNIYIDICKKINNDSTIEITDVYGVTVANSGFCGYHGDTDNPNYAQVCLLGDVEVRVTAKDHQEIMVGDYVVPNELGYASKAENGVGFKVVAKGQKETSGSATTAWYYVRIALVPQNDNVARVMKEIENAEVNLRNITIRLSNLSNKITGIESSNMQLDKDFVGLRDLVNESTNKIDTQLPAMIQTLEDAKKIANDVKVVIQTVQMEYSEAVNKVDDAKKVIDGALSDVAKLQKHMEPLAAWTGDDGSSGVASFLAQAQEDHTELSSLTSAFGNNGSNLTAILQKIDENGAAIQHLVTHVDKYILSEQSPAYGLTLEQTSFIQPGTIYVPTKEGIKETYTYKDGEEENSVEQSFDYGQSYIWAVTENKPYAYMWQPDKPVYVIAPFVIKDGKIELTESLQNEALWYCWQGFLNGDKYLYNPGVLYCWNEDKKIWIPVASVNSSNAASIGSVNQTAKNFQVAYTNLQGDIASLEVKVDEISTTVQDEVKEQISSIHQTAEKIMMGVYDADDGDSTSLGLLLNGMTSTSTDVTPVRIKTVLTENSLDTDKYSSAPTWNGEEFIFVGVPGDSDDDVYCFDPQDSSPYTYYCKIITGGYEVYGINNIAMANLSTRVNNAKSEVESWSRFQKGQNETLTSIGQSADEAGAAISSMVYGDFRECVEINLELTDNDRTDFTEAQYASQPKWDNTTKQFTFEGVKSGNEYCLSNSNTQAYYKLLYRDGAIVGYEKYQMKSSPYAAVVQKVDDNGNSYVGLIAGNDDDVGSMIIESINNHSQAIIGADHVEVNADSILINGTTKFSSLFTEGETTIDGSNITTGTIVVGANDIKTTEYVVTSKTMDYRIAMQYGNGGLYLVSHEVLSKDDLMGAKVILDDGSEYTIDKVYTATGFAHSWERHEDNISLAIYSVFNGTIDVPCGVYFSHDTGKNVEELRGKRAFSNLLATENNTTVIDGGKILTHSITAAQIKSDALQSLEYQGPEPGSNSPYAESGTFFDLADGSITSKNFSISDAAAYFKGTVYATAGEIGGCQIVNGKLNISGSITVGSDDVILSGGSSVFEWPNNGEDLDFGENYVFRQASNYGVKDVEKELVGAIIKWSTGDTYVITADDFGDDKQIYPFADVNYMIRIENDGLVLPRIIISQEYSDYCNWSKGIYFEKLKGYTVVSLTLCQPLSSLFTAGKTTIDGSKITAGSITADQIKAGSIKTEHLATGALTVGADDIILGNAKETHIKWPDNASLQKIFEYYTACKVSDYMISDLKELVGGVVTWSNGKSHTIEGYAKDIWSGEGYEAINVMDESQRHLPSVILVPEDYDGVSAGIYFARFDNTVDGNEYVPNVYVTSLTITTINSLSTLFTPGTTTINGDKITTGSLSADKIKGGTISSSHIMLPFSYMAADTDEDTTAYIKFFDATRFTYAGWLYGVYAEDTDDEGVGNYSRLVLETRNKNYALKIHSQANLSVGALNNTYIYGKEIFVGSSTMSGGTTAIKFQDTTGTYKLNIAAAKNAGILTKIG